MPIVTDAGFAPTDDRIDARLTSAAAIESGGGAAPYAVTLGNDDDPRRLTPYFERIELIVVAFPNFADGRGFSIARSLRALGYGGRLRAKGRLIADQFAMARACGFDEAEIDDALAGRQPEADWLAAIRSAQTLSGHALRARDRSRRAA